MSVFGAENSTSAHFVSSLNSIPLTSTAIWCFLWPIVIICGIFGNTLSLAVLWRMDDSSTISKFLKSLALADTLTLIFHCVQMVYVWVEMFWPYEYRTWMLSSFAFYRRSRLSDRISKAITAAISIDRLIAVSMPLHYKIICRPKRIAVAIVMIYVIITSTCIPLIVDVFVIHIQSKDQRTINTNMGLLYIMSRLSPSKLKSIHFIINMIVFEFTPIPIVLMCNIIIIVCLRKSNVVISRPSEVQQQREQQERQITKLLLTISMLFLALASPSGINTFLMQAGISHDDRLTGKLILDMTLTLSVVNSSINFIIYAVMNKKYREGYIAILCGCRRSNNVDENRRVPDAIEDRA